MTNCKVEALAALRGSLRLVNALGFPVAEECDMQGRSSWWSEPYWPDHEPTECVSEANYWLYEASRTLPGMSDAEIVFEVYDDA